MLKSTVVIALGIAASLGGASPVRQPEPITIKLPRSSADIEEGTQADLKTVLGRVHTGFSLKFAQDAITFLNNTGKTFRYADINKAREHMDLVNLLNSTNVTLPGTKKTNVKAASSSHYVESNFTTNINVPAVRVSYNSEASNNSTSSKRAIVSQKSSESGAKGQAQVYDTAIGTPAQIVSADYLTTSGDIAVPASWIGYGHAWTYIPSQAYYNPTSSKTGTDTFEPVIIGDAYDAYSVWGQGEIWKDTISFGGAAVTQYPFAVLNYQESQWYGGVGLAYPSLSKTLIHRFTTDPFIVALKNAGSIPHSEFYVDVLTPEITLGGYPRSLHWVSNEVSFQGAEQNLALSYSYWATSKITLYNGQVSSGAFENAVLDNSALFSKLPFAQATLFFGASGIIPLFLELPINFVQDFTHAVQPIPITILETVAVWAYACDATGPEKYFDFDGVKIPVTLRDFAAYKVGDLCVAGVYSTILEGLIVDDALSIIGRTFFDRGIVGFNFDTNSIGFVAH